MSQPIAPKPHLFHLESGHDTAPLLSSLACSWGLPSWPEVVRPVGGVHSPDGCTMRTALPMRVPTIREAQNTGPHHPILAARSGRGRQGWDPPT